MNDLNLEITRLEIKKKIIVDELRGNVNEINEDLKLPNMILNMVGVEISENIRSKIYTIFRASVIIFSAVKGGKRVLRSIMSIFK